MTGMLKISKSIIESTGSLILVLSLYFGALIGEFINIEKRIEQFGFYLKSKAKTITITKSITAFEIKTLGSCNNFFRNSYFCLSRIADSLCFFSSTLFYDNNDF